MTRPYSIIADKRIPRGMYRVHVAGIVQRPSRFAAGLAYTRALQGNRGGDEITTLSVRGTLDKIGVRHWFHFERAPCPCCGSKAAGKLRLNLNGRARLKVLRRKYEGLRQWERF